MFNRLDSLVLKEKKGLLWGLDYSFQTSRPSRLIYMEPSLLLIKEQGDFLQTQCYLKDPTLDKLGRIY